MSGNVLIDCAGRIASMKARATRAATISAAGLVIMNSSGFAARAADPLDELRHMWRASAYQDVLVRLLDYRNGRYGKNAEVDYMIATSACRLPDLRDLGHQQCQRILYNYDLSPDARALVEQERDWCGNAQKPVELTVVDFNGTIGVIGVFGKTFYWVGENNIIASSPAEVLEQIPFEQIQARRFPAQEQPEAEDAIRRLAGDSFEVAAHGPFVMASASGHSHDELRRIADGLTLAYEFYLRAYDMAPPESLIPVYLVPDAWALGQLAERIHGVRISEATIGYSFADDLSLAGAVPGGAYGTLIHELFHLLVKANFGDIPMWMEEGLASLYEVSAIVGSELVGIENWRREVLQELWPLRPTVAELVTMDARAFQSAEEDFELESQAAAHAMARYFSLYLQERGQLVPLYQAFRNRPFDRLTTPPELEALEVTQTVLRQPLDEVDADFAAWFDAGPHEFARPSDPRSEKTLPRPRAN